MAFATTSDGIRLFYETAGSGSPIIFVHEFGGNHWSWEPQMNFFARRHRCVTYAARGFSPSDCPDDVKSYSQPRAADDIMYFYASRLPGEPASGVEDKHFHPAEPRTLRLSLVLRL